VGCAACGCRRWGRWPCARPTAPGEGSDQVARDIPGASYERLPGGEFVFLKHAGPHAVDLAAERPGSLDVKLRLFEDGRAVETVLYLGVQVGPAGQARLALPSLERGGRPALEVDGDGDGAFERALAPSAVLGAAESSDTAPPTLAVSPAIASTGGVVVRWRAADDRAGLLREWAVLDPGTPAARAVANGETVALTPGQHRLRIVALDRAGNAVSREVVLAA
jgi:hypothetical protein